MASLRDQLLGQKPRTKVLSVPGFATPIRIQEMTVARRLRFFELLRDNIKAVTDHENDPENNPAVAPIDEALLGFVFSLVDEKDELVLSPDDLDSLSGLPYSAVQSIYLEAMALSHVSASIEEIELEKKD